MAVNFGRLGTVTFGRNAGIVCTPESRIASPPSADVTPNPTPAWSNIFASDAPSYGYTTQQVTGIDTTINIRITTAVQIGIMPVIYIRSTLTSPSFSSFLPPAAQGFTELTVGTLFAVAPNSYISFGCDFGPGGEEDQGVVTVFNDSDGGVQLRNFLANTYIF